ncbi:hypothetical protein Sfulv_13760 [Streptomyces fulvorobeus]|uniref:Probable peptidoglycan glycosyltransferase FtsW n=1 Tax=Streptomyces fulvorobeus TaxID=284028 RepID=A0A7J0C222_9ACTN|nr:hypothetical protein Sfulv_13760 [Streptomyces fulvorobeus]
MPAEESEARSRDRSRGTVPARRALTPGLLGLSTPAGPPPPVGLVLRGKLATGSRRPPVPRGGRTSGGPRPPRTHRVRRLHERARRAWDRPLTAYYLILGSSLLITVLGLVMVYSASVIKALDYDKPASYFFRKQFLAAVIGAGLMFIASRMPAKLHRALAYPCS